MYASNLQFYNTTNFAGDIPIPLIDFFGLGWVQIVHTKVVRCHEEQHMASFTGRKWSGLMKHFCSTRKASRRGFGLTESSLHRRISLQFTVWLSSTQQQHMALSAVKVANVFAPICASMGVLVLKWGAVRHIVGILLSWGRRKRSSNNNLVLC